jgi:hypothetical protein
MHFSTLILKGFPFSFFVLNLPVIASEGQTLAHLPQEVQTSETIRYLRRARQTLAGHRLWMICS